MNTVIALSIGASLGAIARWALGQWLNVAGHVGIGWGTLASNCIGAYLIGIGYVWLHSQPGIDPVWRLLLITGFVGALTTFSTFSLETIQLLADGHAGSALANVATNLAGSLVLTYLGLLSGQAFWHITK